MYPFVYPLLRTVNVKDPNYYLACYLMNTIESFLPISDEEIKGIEGTANTVIFDGVISQRLVDVAAQKGIKKLVAFKSMNIVKKPHNVKLITID